MLQRRTNPIKYFLEHPIPVDVRLRHPIISFFVEGEMKGFDESLKISECRKQYKKVSWFKISYTLRTLSYNGVE